MLHLALSSEDRRIDAETRANAWLGKWNELVESGKGETKAAAEAERKGQFWLDRLNKLEGKD